MKKKITDEFICLILARKGSKRIKDKNLVKLKGKPLIEFTIKAAAKVIPPRNIFISTNDNRIKQITKKYKINYIKRPEKISKDDSSSEDAILHAINFFKERHNAKHIIFLQPTSPLRTSIDILNCVQKYKKKKLDSIFSVFLAKRFIWIKTKKLLSLTFNYKKRKRSQNLQKLIIENGAIFIFNIKKFMKFKNRIFGKFDYFEMTENKSFDIDNLEDLEIVKKIIS